MRGAFILASPPMLMTLGYEVYVSLRHGLQGPESVNEAVEGPLGVAV